MCGRTGRAQKRMPDKGWRPHFDDPMLVKGYADLLSLAPDDMTGNARPIRPKNKVETLRDVERVCNIERRSRNGNVSDEAVLCAASELNCSRHQYGFAGTGASFHEPLIFQNPLEIDKAGFCVAAVRKFIF
jgi:hypothetical protein